jgi:hypothetical protein
MIKISFLFRDSNPDPPALKLVTANATPNLMATRIHELFLSKAVSYLDSQEKRKYVEK